MHSPPLCFLRLGVVQSLDVGFGAEKVRLCPLDVCLDERRIEPGEHLPLPDDRVEVRGE
jgi:hypothetical protein